MRLHQLFPQPELRAQVFRAEMDAQLRINRLTPMQRKVMDLLVEGRPNKVIAHNLGLSVRTVENHRAAINGSLDVKSFADLIRIAILAELDAVEACTSIEFEEPI
jgi:two-component system response regulator FixJ